MATIRRIGFGTIFELENDVVGIGTDNPTHKLQALGNIRSEAATDIGISTFSTYQGFVDKEARFTTGQIDNQSQSGSTSGEIVIDGDVTVSSATTFTSGPQNLTVTDTFTLPSGDTNSRELKPTAGSLRFNQDFATLEFYTGNNWATVNTFTEIQNSPGNRGRGIFGGGQPAIGAGAVDPIQYIQIQSKGNAQSFGELTSTGHGAANVSCCSSSIRGLFMGGSNPNNNYMNVIEYITIASAGNAIDFGDLTARVSYTASCSSSTRGINMGGFVGTPASPTFTTNTMSYVEIMTLGNALDFGDVQQASYSAAGASNGTRGMFAGGYIAPNNLKIIESFTIASKGNANTFGDLSAIRWAPSGSSNRTRMVVAGGRSPENGANSLNTIEFITMASEGNGIDFGNMSIDKVRGCSVADQTRCVFATGAQHPSGATNIIEFILITSGGSTEDFGDMISATQYAMGSCSDSHGGLGGF